MCRSPRLPRTFIAYLLQQARKSNSTYSKVTDALSHELAADDGIALRKFTDEFRLTDTWLVAFANVDDAKAALKKVAGARIALKTLEASLVFIIECSKD